MIVCGLMGNKRAQEFGKVRVVNLFKVNKKCFWEFKFPGEFKDAEFHHGVYASIEAGSVYEGPFVDGK
jgi:hypothetical protein